MCAEGRHMRMCPSRAWRISAGIHGVFKMKIVQPLGILALKMTKWVGIPALLQPPEGHRNTTEAFCISVPQL